MANTTGNRVNNTYSIYLPTGVYATSGTALSDFLADSANYGLLAAVDAETGLTLASTDTALAKEHGVIFYWQPEKDFIKRSPAVIFPSMIKAFTNKCPTAFQERMLEFSNYTLEFDEEYYIKVVLRNSVITQSFGMEGINKIFTYKTEKQIGTATSPDYGKFVIDIIKQSLREDDGLVKVEAYVDDGTGTNTFIYTQDETLITNYANDNPNQPITLRFTIYRLPLPSERVQLKYFDQLEVASDIYYQGVGFENAILTEVQPLVYENVPGYKIKWMEYSEGGEIGNPQYRGYRTSNVEYLKEYKSFADVSKTYGLLTLLYETKSISLNTAEEWSLEDRFAFDNITNQNTARAFIEALFGLPAGTDCV